MNKKYIVFDIETTGLRPWDGNVVTCICAKTNEGKIFSSVGNDETKILTEFLIFLKENDNLNYILISKNGKHFDVPFVMTRLTMCFVNKRISGIPFRLMQYEHYDLQEVTKRWVNLDDMATILGCENKSGTGGNAIELFKEKKYDELESYCMQDVEVTEQVYLKIQANRRVYK